MDSSAHRLLIAGDIFPAPTNVELFSKGDIGALFGEKIVNLFKSADYSIANFEGALTDISAKQEKSGPVIVAPTRSLCGIKNLGVSAVALANNHITDSSNEGCLEMLKVLSEQGIDYVGCGTADDMKRYLTIILGDKKVCIYNVSERFFNAPTPTTVGAHLYDEWLVCNEIKDLKRCHDYVVVIYHGGSEYFQYPTPVVSERCHRMADCGADVITTQHTHCIGCEEKYHDTYILHGQGNFCFGFHKAKERQLLTRKGILLELVFSESGIQVNKHMVSLQENAYTRYDDPQDFSDFDNRSLRVAAGDDFTEELMVSKFKELGRNYISAAKGNDLILRIIKKFFHKHYQKVLYSSYSRNQTLTMLSTLQGDRRNEEMRLVWKYIFEHYAK